MEFPIEYFPASIKEAVNGIHAYTNAPAELIASVALGYASFAVQGLYNTTAHRFTSPSSLFVIVLQESGGLKSEIMKLLGRGARRHIEENEPEFESAVEVYQAEQTNWEVEMAAARKIKLVSDRKLELARLMADKPVFPLEPDRRVEQPTVVGFTRAFQKKGPSIGHFSSEAGVFLSGTAMSDPAQARQLVSIMSKVWSGEEYDRQTGDEQAKIKDSRLTACWLTQGIMASDFLSNPVFGAQGILARFLVIQAPRYEAPDADYADADGRKKKQQAESACHRFNDSIYRLLNEPLSLRIGNNGEPERHRLEPPIMEWEPETVRVQQEWVNAFCKPYRNGCHDDDANKSFYQRIEEHAARVATVLAALDGKAEVNRESVLCAQKLLEWVTLKLAEIDKSAVSESDEIQAYRALKVTLAKSKGKTIRLRDLLRGGPRAFRGAKEAVRNAALRRAQDEGLIEHKVETSGAGQQQKVVEVAGDTSQVWD